MEYCIDHADHVVSGVDWVDYMPRWDTNHGGALRPRHEAELAPAPEPSDRDSERPVVVFHAPNHRELKGTRFLIAACEELRAEGEPIELRLGEKMPNSEVRRQLAEADIVADQFIVGWYAFFAIEGMATAKPVLCYLRPRSPRAVHALLLRGRVPAREHAPAGDQGTLAGADPRP